jgi:hydroxypyruvate reductase
LMTELTSRELLVHLYETAVDAVDGRQLVQQWCRDNPSSLFSHCVAIGKAATPMLQGALDSQYSINSALLITPRGVVTRDIKRNKKVKIIESAHPVPDQSSLDAGHALIDYLHHIPQGASLLVLVSGGTSSLAEVLIDGISLAQLQKINQYLLASGKGIHAMNVWRKQFSKIKGGGLLQHVQHLQCTQLLISDVYGNDPAVIGSGLLVSSDDEQADGDTWLQSQLPEDANKTMPCNPVVTHVIGNLETAMHAVIDEAMHQRLAHYLHHEFISGDAVKQGKVIGTYLLDAAAGVHVWGGETTVELPEKPGLGGRNQSLALSLATAIDGANGLSVLVAGTDGIDGNTPCAGAVVSGDSIRLARQMGFAVDAELANANAGMVLMAIGDLFKPGPTNTNVMDIIIAYRRNQDTD